LAEVRQRIFQSLAKVTAYTLSAPAFIRVLEHSSIVEQVVHTSSTSKTVFPSTSEIAAGSSLKLPEMLLLLCSLVNLY
jgi:hypothetical protein